MNIYHVVNRGVDKRNIVLDDFDRVRFVQNLYLFNNVNNVLTTTRKSGGVRDKNSLLNTKRRQLVEIYAWCLMDNHYHLLLSPKDDDFANLSAFMKKINMGYAKYFNERYDRTGYLWQGKYRKIIIERDAHFMYIPYYIHLNPLDYSHKQWRLGKIDDTEKAVDKLHDYRWSSFLDYFGLHNFPSLINKELLSETLGSTKNQKKEIQRIISSNEIASESNKIE